MNNKKYMCPKCNKESVHEDWDLATKKYFNEFSSNDIMPILSEDLFSEFCCPKCEELSDMDDILFVTTAEEYGKNIGYCPWCDEILLDDPFCTTCGDTTGLQPHWYERGNIYPMERCIKDLYETLVSVKSELKDERTLSLIELTLKENQKAIKKVIDDFNK